MFGKQKTSYKDFSYQITLFITLCYNEHCGKIQNLDREVSSIPGPEKSFDLSCLMISNKQII